MNSYWIENSGKTDYPNLSKNINTDVLIVGAGITGILTAYMLSNSGLKIAIVDSDKIAMGVTANTTAKITSQHGLIYNYLINSYGFDIAKMYLNSNEEALSNIHNIILKENIDCDFSFQNSYVYTCNQSNMAKVADEVSSVNALGFNAEYISECPLPFSIKAGIKFPKQAQFHPRKYLLSLLPILENKKIQIFENTKIIDIKHSSNQYLAYSSNNIITSKYLVIASHYPIKNFPGMYFLKMYQNTSYAIGVEVDEPLFNRYIYFM